MPSQLWDIVGAVAGALSFVFAVYIYFINRKNQLSEAAKIEIYKERLASLHFQISASLYSVDSIVQLSKQDDISVITLQSIARVTRGQLYSIIEQVEDNRNLLKSWQYGKMVKSSENIAPQRELINNVGESLSNPKQN